MSIMLIMGIVSRFEESGEQRSPIHLTLISTLLCDSIALQVRVVGYCWLYDVAIGNRVDILRIALSCLKL